MGNENTGERGNLERVGVNRGKGRREWRGGRKEKKEREMGRKKNQRKVKNEVKYH